MTKSPSVEKVELVAPAALEMQLTACLRHRRLPDHFLYLGSAGAKNWLDLERSEEFPVARRLTELLSAQAGQIAADVPEGALLVSLGVGQGHKERILLEALPEKRPRGYLAVDISGPLVDRALQEVRDIGVPATGVVAFSEDLPRLRARWWAGDSGPVLLCMLGNNFCNYEPRFLLPLIRRALRDDDLLLLDCQLFDSTTGEGTPEAIEEAYGSDLNERFNLQPLITLGLQPQRCRFRLDLVEVDSPVGKVRRTRKQIEILSDTVVTVGREDVALPAGSTVRMGFTYKYTAGQVSRLLEHYQMREVRRFVGNAGDNLLVLARMGPVERDPPGPQAQAAHRIGRGPRPPQPDAR